jgi:type II secretory pathway pseudopilin PulG
MANEAEMNLKVERGRSKHGRESGYAMAALLVSLAVMSVLMSVAMPVWRHQVQREKEAELVFRGEQYARAVGLFQRRFAGAFPPSIDVLVDQKFLRRRYRDPMVPDGEFQVLYQTTTPPGVPQGGTARTPGGPVTPPPAAPAPGIVVGGAAPGVTGTTGPAGGIIGVTSKSTQPSIRLYNGRSRYNEWQFIYVPTTIQGGATPGPGAAVPGGGGGPAGSTRPGPPGAGSQFPRGVGPQPARPPSPTRPPD